MKEIVGEMQGKLLLQEKNLSSVKKVNSPWGENNIKNRLVMDDLEEDRKEFKELFELSSPVKVCEECLKRKDSQE